MKLTLFPSFFLLLAVCFNLFAAPSDELDFKKQLDLLDENVTINFDERLEQLEQLLSVAEKNDWRHSKIRTMVSKAESYLAMQQLQSAQEILSEYLPLTYAPHLLESNLRLKLIQISINDAQGNSNKLLIQEVLNRVDDLEDIKTIGSIYSAIGNTFYGKRQYEKAVEMQNKARKLFESANYQTGLAMTVNALANIYSAIYDYDKAVEYYKETLAFTKKSGDDYSTSVILYNLASVYLLQEKDDLAETTLTKSLAISQKLNDESSIAYTQMALADLYNVNKEYEKSLIYYNQSIEFFEATGDTRNVVFGTIYRAAAQLELGKTEEAKQNIDKLKPIVESFEDKGVKILLKRIQSKYAANIGDYETAYEILREVEKDRQKIDEESKNKQESMQEMLIEYDIEKRENENRLLQKENELQALRLEREQKESTIWRLAMAFTVLVLVIIGYLLQRILANRNHFQQMALRDHLTEAPNRRAILQFAEQQFQIARRNRTPFTIGIIDLDFFKRINDSYGHDVGDEVLKAFSTALSCSLRQQDSFGRYGGEEFLLVLNNTHIADVDIVFTRVNEKLQSIDIPDLPDDHKVTFSLGAAQLIGKDVNLNQLIKRADEQLYKAKENGRNQFQIATD